MGKRQKNEYAEVRLYAFRYALSRNSMAISTITELLIREWDSLCQYEKEQYISETLFAIEHSVLMDSTSRGHWRGFLETIGGIREAC